jgi:lipid-binding SYLF domain-containing protein
MYRYTLCAVVLTFAGAPAFALPPNNEKTLEQAADVLTDLAEIPLKSIPPKMLADAQGVAIIPRVVKAGFVVGGRGGHGVVLAKNKDGGWADPVFVNIGGASVGFQAGVESTDVVLVFRNRKSLDRLLEGKGKVTLGADAAIAAGPIGRNAMAGTDAKLEAEIYSYSRSRGLFAGVSFDGAVIRPDPDSTARFQKSPADMKAADALKKKLVELSIEKPAPVPAPVPLPGPVPIPGPAPVPIPSQAPLVPPVVVPERP